MLKAVLAAENSQCIICRQGDLINELKGLYTRVKTSRDKEECLLACILKKRESNGKVFEDMKIKTAKVEDCNGKLATSESEVANVLA